MPGKCLYAQTWFSKWFVAETNPRVYPDRDDNPDACSTWEDEEMTQDMYLLGSVLLHEYT